MSNKFPLIAKWLPGLDTRIEYFTSPPNAIIDAEALEAELAKGLVAYSSPAEEGHYTRPKDYEFWAWESLMIGKRPIVRERKRELSESEVRKILKDFSVSSGFDDYFIEKLFGGERE